MKKFLSLILAMMMFLSVTALAEDAVIGGADEATSIHVTAEPMVSLQAKALAAGRRVTETLTITELTGIDTGDEMGNEAISMLVEALGMHMSRQGDEMDMAITISGQDALNIGGALSGEELYLNSNLLGGTVVVNAAEAEAVANRILDTAVLLEMMTAENAELMRTEIAGMKESFEAAMAEEAAEDAALESINTEALEALLANFPEKIVPVEQFIVPRMCDLPVVGVQGVITNADMNQIVLQEIQFLLDNPQLLDVIGAAVGMPTEEAVAAAWASSGNLYMKFGIYADEAAFREANPTMVSILRDLQEQFSSEESAWLADDYVITVYGDEEGLPVYISAVMPIIVDGETININATYTRQTVPQGVAHVCNLFVDDFSVTVDALISEDAKTFAVSMNDPEIGMMKLFDLSIVEGVNAANPNVTDLDVTATIHDGFNPMLTVVYDGEYEFSDARQYLAGHLTATVYAYSTNVAVEVVDAETGDAELIDTTVEVHGHDAAEYVNAQMVCAIDFCSDTVIDGVDYKGKTTASIEANGFRYAFEVTEETGDPVDSIMTGAVIRPAELDDAAFTEWFVGVVEGCGGWLSDLMMLLPEDVLTWIMYSSMM